MENIRTSEREWDVEEIRYIEELYREYKDLDLVSCIGLDTYKDFLLTVSPKEPCKPSSLSIDQWGNPGLNGRNVYKNALLLCRNWKLTVQNRTA
jgi:hypothetical protein